MRVLDRSVAYFNRMLALASQGKLDDAIRFGNEALAIRPNLIHVHTMLGVLYAKKGDLNKALEECKKELSISPYSPLTHYNLAFVYANKRRFREARQELETTLKLDPSFGAAKKMLRDIDRYAGGAR